MKTLTSLPKQILLLLLLVIPAFLMAQENENDKTLSPYFLVKGAGSSGQMPLLGTAAKVNIAGVIADVQVTQTYKNSGKQAIEAVYVFPASSKAAVYDMQMKIGNRIIQAEIKEKQKAREEYEAAKAEGKRTSLLEQSRPNVFQMNVANIMPGETIEVSLKYTELLVPEAGQYQFVYPTVVGPRYSETPAAGAADSEQFIATPYQRKDAVSSYDFNLEVFLNAGMRLRAIDSPSHEINISHPNMETAEIKLPDTEKKGGNRDFILNYRLSGEKLASGVLFYEHDDENFFLLTVQPPKRITPDVIPAREYIFIVDVSGSMNGWPLDVSKKLLRDLITGLNEKDKFNVLFFAGGSSVLSPQASLTANETNLNRALGFMDNQRGGGGTRLLPALTQAIDLPKAKGMSRSVIVVTDGYISVEREVFDLIRKNLDAANLFSFGIGSGINRYLIEGMAHVGQGEPLMVTDMASASEKAEQFRQYINSPVLTQVKAKFNGLEVYDVAPSSIPDVLAERPVVLHGKYKGTPNGNIEITGYSGDAPWKKTIELSGSRPDSRNSALRYLWAREQIRLLDDYRLTFNGSNEAAKTTELGLKYNLMTAYTSFLAVDYEVVNKGKKTVKVKQALPLPAKVEESAVGFEMEISGVSRAATTKALPKVQNSVLRFGKLKLELESKELKLFSRLSLVQQVELKQCLLQLHPHKQARQISIEIGRDGKVRFLSLSGKHIPDEVRSCLSEKLNAWKFTPAEAGTYFLYFTIDS